MSGFRRELWHVQGWILDSILVGKVFSHSYWSKKGSETVKASNLLLKYHQIAPASRTSRTDFVATCGLKVEELQSFALARSSAMKSSMEKFKNSVKRMWNTSVLWQSITYHTYYLFFFWPRSNPLLWEPSHKNLRIWAGSNLLLDEEKHRGPLKGREDLVNISRKRTTLIFH